MTSFYPELILLASTRVDGVHMFPVDGLDQCYAVDNGNAIYVFLPRTAQPDELDRIMAGLDTIKLVKSSSPLIDLDAGYDLFRRSKNHTTSALELLDSIFEAAVEHPEAFRT